MATQSYLYPREQAIIELIEAIKLEVAYNSPNYEVNKENFDIWYSIKENAELLLNECNKYLYGS